VFRQPAEAAPLGGESIGALIRRVAAWLDAQPDDRDAAVVAPPASSAPPSPML
jgi:hypothetical protein